MSASRRGSGFALMAAAAALLPLALALGCQRPAPSAEAIADLSSTPEGQLENVMKRFQFALEHARTAEGAAVVSERAATHRLLPPSDEQQGYEAEVTITTSLGLAPALVEEIAKETAPPPADPIAPDGAAPKEGDASEHIAEEAAENIVEKARVSEKTVVKLRFQNDRWEVVDPPVEKLSDVERECFRYALSDG